MKIFLTALLLSLSATWAYSQEDFTLNDGGTSQKNYYTEIEYEDIRWAPIIKVTINGKEYRFAVDTGAPNTITKALFDVLKPKILSKIPIHDANDNVDSLNIVNLSEITVGGVVFNDVPTVVPNNSFFFDCLKIDGLIGSNMLRNSIVQFSPKNRKIILTDQPDKLNLNQKQSTDLFLSPGQSEPFVTIIFIGKSTGTIGTLFDTGSAGLFDLSLVHFAGTEGAEVFNVLAKSKGRNSMALYGTGIDTAQYRIRVPEFRINGTAFKNVNANTTPGEQSRIGSKLLDYGIVTVDYKNRKFYFEPFQTSIDLLEGTFPVTFIPKDNKIFIEMIWDEQMKDKVNVNDQVLAIDDIDYTNISMCDFLLKTDLYEGKNQAILTLKTPDGTIKKVTISKR
ncbi:retropepsin-like aspartic protease [Pedobacter sp. B4-66]|uniref:retropepsin-like aspartic protease n=1 Tax=Pedobacter sp. B4-66 TaxID=2817280 RepID=UPI001BDB1DB9|nr:retropepsin-like aspartic protease [Pedobacter sp. B4-66]